MSAEPEVFQSDDENEAYLATTDQFYDDGKLREDEALVAFNLSLKENADDKVSIIGLLISRYLNAMLENSYI